MNFLSLIPGLSWLRLTAIALALAALAALAWKLHHSGIVSGRAEIQAQWDAEKLEVAKQTQALLIATREKESALILSQETLRKAKDARIAQIDANLTIALNGLRDRPERPSNPGVPTVDGTTTEIGCTGAGLFSADAGFLIRESSRANRLLADLAQCQTQYNAAREAVK